MRFLVKNFLFSPVQKWIQSPDRVVDMLILVWRVSSMFGMSAVHRIRSMKLRQCMPLGD